MAVAAESKEQRDFRQIHGCVHDVFKSRAQPDLITPGVQGGVTTFFEQPA